MKTSPKVSGFLVRCGLEQEQQPAQPQMPPPPLPPTYSADELSTEQLSALVEAGAERGCARAIDRKLGRRGEASGFLPSGWKAISFNVVVAVTAIGGTMLVKRWTSKKSQPAAATDSMGAIPLPTKRTALS